jgi:hypothetical protein
VHHQDFKLFVLGQQQVIHFSGLLKLKLIREEEKDIMVQKRAIFLFL